MRGRISFAVCAVSLALAGVGTAGQLTAANDGPTAVNPDSASKRSEAVAGTVTRIDVPNRVIVFDDSRMYRLTEDGAILVDNRAVEFGTLAPGQRVQIVAAQPVAWQNGQYVVVTPPGAAVVAPAPPAAVAVAPPSATVITAPSTTVTTITTQPAAADPRIAGTVTRIDETAGVIVFSAGRSFQAGPSSVILVDGRPVTLTEVRPGMQVVVSAANPVVYRNGRYALLNQGVFDARNGSNLGWESVYEGYDADTSNAGMSIQSQ